MIAHSSPATEQMLRPSSPMACNNPLGKRNILLELQSAGRVTADVMHRTFPSHCELQLLSDPMTCGTTTAGA